MILTIFPYFITKEFQQLFLYYSLQLQGSLLSLMLDKTTLHIQADPPVPLIVTGVASVVFISW